MLIKAALIKPGDLVIHSLDTEPRLIESISFISVFDRNSIRCSTPTGILWIDINATVIRLDKYRIYFTGAQK